MRLIQLIFHGTAADIGKSCIEAVFVDNTGKKVRIVMDAGMKNVSRQSSLEERYVTIPEVEKVAGVLISHCHMDHFSSLPYWVKKGYSGQIFCSPMTKRLAPLMYKDNLKLGEEHERAAAYGQYEVEKVLSLMNTTEQKGVIEGVKYQLIPVGHIPGAMGIYLQADEGPSVFYTGDFSGKDTRLTKGCNFKALPKADILITEATYGAKPYQSRKRLEKRLKTKVLKTIQNGGSVVIPAFAVARSQELIMILHDLFEEKVYYRRCIDGMGKPVTEAMLMEPESLKNSEALRVAFFCNLKLNGYTRETLKKEEKPSVIVTTSGMLSEKSPAISHVRALEGDRKNLILIPGFQAPDTLGRELLETGKMTFESGETIRPKCRVAQVRLSSHADLGDQKKMLRAVDPKIVIVQHGDEKSCLEISDLAQEKGCETIIPRSGEILYF